MWKGKLLNRWETETSSASEAKTFRGGHVSSRQPQYLEEPCVHSGGCLGYCVKMYVWSINFIIGLKGVSVKRSLVKQQSKNLHLWWAPHTGIAWAKKMCCIEECKRKEPSCGGGVQLVMGRHLQHSTKFTGMDWRCNWPEALPGVSEPWHVTLAFLRLQNYLQQWHQSWRTFTLRYCRPWILRKFPGFLAVSHGCLVHCLRTIRKTWFLFLKRFGCDLVLLGKFTQSATEECSTNCQTSDFWRPVLFFQTCRGTVHHRCRACCRQILSLPLHYPWL